ncbi:hypothetical protein H0H81_012659 [Sphagnurus paluster]|uniref:N-acetyltransferase domain-containing protein n=1 Tax=Sphagnurus paluster TaxID=117069 RepID=A0A9P7G0V9_9AGAR|nr:hypothetical protein H0H81_012659 [Sphagnurus paluster]
MPSLASNISTETYDNARSLPTDVWHAIRSNARNANIVLPQTNKALADEKSFLDEIICSPIKSLWIVCRSHANVEFVLAVTEGFMGAYPIFIYTTLPFHNLTNEYIYPSIEVLVIALAAAVPRRRVYSIFAVEPIARVFAGEWTRFTGISNYATNPYYAAKISYCTANTLARQQNPPANYNLRVGVTRDIQGIAELCYLFAKDSPPFCLTKEAALYEATQLVKKSQVWIHEAQQLGGGEIACIVAFTRNSETVAAITKVCTNPKWRRRGCAGRLVHKVCDHLLKGAERKESVVLYVAHDNHGAANVYHRVGFVGLGGGPEVEGVDPWLDRFRFHQSRSRPLVRSS